jgi:hypothetical protein
MNALEEMFGPPKELPAYRETLSTEGDGWAYSRALYGWCGRVCSGLGSIDRESPCLRRSSEVAHAVTIGLLVRCGRLLLANLTLGADGEFGETIAIVERSAFETAIELRWLVHDDIEAAARSYIAAGMRNELAMREVVSTNVQAREGATAPIEDRLLGRVPHLLELAGMEEAELEECAAWPNLFDMMSAVGYSRAQYVAIQKMSSLAVHGRWTSLLHHSIERQEGRWMPREYAPALVDHWLNPLPLILDALADVVRARFQGQERDALSSVCDEIREHATWAADELHRDDRTVR